MFKITGGYRTPQNRVANLPLAVCGAVNVQGALKLVNLKAVPL